MPPRRNCAACCCRPGALGVKNILALRGDPPGGNGVFTSTEGGFEYSCQLVQFIKEMGGFCIGTAGFPEGHVACREGREADWDHLKNKIDCGADFVLTQLFFANEDFFRFRDYLRKKGVTVPVCPGIIPIQSAHQIKRFTALCGAALPAPLLASLEKYLDDDEGCARIRHRIRHRGNAPNCCAGACRACTFTP